MKPQPNLRLHSCDLTKGIPMESQSADLVLSVQFFPWMAREEENELLSFLRFFTIERFISQGAHSSSLDIPSSLPLFARYLHVIHDVARVLKPLGEAMLDEDLLSRLPPMHPVFTEMLMKERVFCRTGYQEEHPDGTMHVIGAANPYLHMKKMLV